MVGDGVELEDANFDFDGEDVLVVVGFDEVPDVVKGVDVCLVEEVEAFLVELGCFLSPPNLTEPTGPKLTQDGDIVALSSCTEEVNGDFGESFAGSIDILQ